MQFLFALTPLQCVSLMVFVVCIQTAFLCLSLVSCRLLPWALCHPRRCMTNTWPSHWTTYGWFYWTSWRRPKGVCWPRCHQLCMSTSVVPNRLHSLFIIEACCWLCDSSSIHVCQFISLFVHPRCWFRSDSNCGAHADWSDCLRPDTSTGRVSTFLSIGDTHALWGSLIP